MKTGSGLVIVWVNVTAKATLEGAKLASFGFFEYAKIAGRNPGAVALAIIPLKIRQVRMGRS